MASAATFNYASWSAAWSSLASTTPEATAQAYFDMACLWLRNDGYGPVWSDTVQAQLMNLLVAHLATLNQDIGSSSSVGRTASASQGGWSTSLDFPMSNQGKWFEQTQPGAMFWAAMAPYRTMRYRPGPVRRTSWP